MALHSARGYLELGEGEHFIYPHAPILSQDPIMVLALRTKSLFSDPEAQAVIASSASLTSRSIRSARMGEARRSDPLIPCFSRDQNKP